jgi:hypothetical protein
MSKPTGQVIIIHAYIPALQGRSVTGGSQRGLHVGHVVSIRSPLSNRAEESRVKIVDCLVFKNWSCGDPL